MIDGKSALAIDQSQQLRQIGYLGNPSSFTGTYISYLAHEAVYFDYEYNTFNENDESSYDEIVVFDGDHYTESANNENVIVFNAYIPLGVGFRISNNHEIFKHMHLFYEIRPSVHVTSVPELRTFTNPAIQHGIGVKVQWN